MSRRVWGIVMLTMLPIAGVLAFIVWWLSRRPSTEVSAPRLILVESGAPRPRPGSESTAVKVSDLPTSGDAAPGASKPASTRKRLAPIGDDLKLIEGIGPKIALLLERNGIRTYAQLGQSSLENLGSILKSANLRFVKPTTWPEQARLAAAGDWEGLKGLQKALKGGVRS